MIAETVEQHVLAPSGGIPNSRLPLLLLRGAVREDARKASAAKRLLENAGWTGTWVYTVFPFWHFHTRGHEVLACVAGEALIGFGGEDGIEAQMGVGDACLIPAGVGHRRMEASDDFQVAGGYPPGQEGDIVRPGEMEDGAIRAALAALTLPATDPLTGARPGVIGYWLEMG